MQIETKPIQTMQISPGDKLAFAILFISLIGFSALAKTILSIPNEPLVTPGGWIAIVFLIFWVTQSPDSRK